MNEELTVDDVIEELKECLYYANKLKEEGASEEQDLGSLVDSIRDTVNGLEV